MRKRNLNGRTIGNEDGQQKEKRKQGRSVQVKPTGNGGNVAERPATTLSGIGETQTTIGNGVAFFGQREGGLPAVCTRCDNA